MRSLPSLRCVVFRVLPTVRCVVFRVLPSVRCVVFHVLPSVCCGAEQCVYVWVWVVWLGLVLTWGKGVAQSHRRLVTLQPSGRPPILNGNLVRNLPRDNMLHHLYQRLNDSSRGNKTKSSHVSVVLPAADSSRTGC